MFVLFRNFDGLIMTFYFATSWESWMLDCETYMAGLCHGRAASNWIQKQREFCGSERMTRAVVIHEQLQDILAYWIILAWG